MNYLKTQKVSERPTESRRRKGADNIILLLLLLLLLLLSLSYMVQIRLRKFLPLTAVNVYR